MGYSKTMYLSTSKPALAAPPAPPARNSAKAVDTMQVVGVEHSIYLRSTPSDNTTYIMEIPVGAYVEYLGNAGNGYYKIRYKGNVGYGTAAYLR